MGVDIEAGLCYSNIADKLPVWWNGRHRSLKISREQYCTGSTPVTGTTFLNIAE